ncbi:MAG TPA: serine/threonine-protein kinase, partial [Gemmataceae bacterium]|nr:serine/threonine-protein kinase [Gemmataceae bacterium]
SMDKHLDANSILDANAIAQLALKVGLVNESQVQDAWMELGQKGGEAEPFLKVLERRSILTPYQISKLRKGDADGYFLGGYKILYKIASGSFGRVYRAEDPNSGRIVAIKVLRKRWSDDDHTIDLFEREGRVGLNLRHPNIVETLAVAQDPVTKQYYIVMEFVEGGNLRDILGIRGKLKAAEALRFIEDAVSGIAHAYSRGVTHRDMKLTNVLISSQGVAKLVDFGLAGIFSRKGLELEGEKMDRTVDYAGLEKRTGVKSGDVRSDIYFLGCVLYEMLTERSPLTMTKDPRVRMSPQRFDSVLPMRREEVDGPPSIFVLVERMMSLDPKLRYQTPAQLLDAVREVRHEIDTGEAGAMSKPAPRSVFVVEKDERLQDAMREGFKEKGFRVFVAADPARALDRFNMQPYDALVLDAGTTGEEGRFTFELILKDAVRKGVSCAGILILSEEQADWAHEIPEQPEIAVLVRPLTLKRLQRKLESLVPEPAPGEC